MSTRSCARCGYPSRKLRARRLGACITLCRRHAAASLEHGHRVICQLSTSSRSLLSGAQLVPLWSLEGGRLALVQVLTYCYFMVGASTERV